MTDERRANSERPGTGPLTAFRECFGAPRALIGMLHVGALPGTPSATHSIETLIRQALAEAKVYRDAGLASVGGAVLLGGVVWGGAVPNV